MPREETAKAQGGDPYNPQNDAAANYTPNDGSLYGSFAREFKNPAAGPVWFVPGSDIGQSRDALSAQIAAQYGAARHGDPNSEAQRALARGAASAQRNAGSYGASQMGLSKGGQQAMAGQMQGQIRSDAARAQQQLLAAEQLQAKQRYADMLKAQRITDIDQYRAAAGAYGGDQASRAAASEAEADRSQNLVSAFDDMVSW